MSELGLVNRIVDGQIVALLQDFLLTIQPPLSVDSPGFWTLSFFKEMLEQLVGWLTLWPHDQTRHTLTFDVFQD